MRKLTPPAPVSREPITDAECAAMFRAVLNVFRLWNITDEQAAVLLDMPHRTNARSKASEAGPFGDDCLARLNSIIGIHKALRNSFSDASRGNAWIKAPNDVFAGQTALDVMLQGKLSDLIRVRRVLDAETDGG